MKAAQFFVAPDAFCIRSLNRCITEACLNKRVLLG
jgi:hypothetical protein